LHGARAVGGRDAGGDTRGSLDGHGEGGTVLGAVAPGHGRQLQAFAMLARQCQADQAAAVPGHEVDGLGRDQIGRQHEITFVFTVFLVNQDDHAAGRQLGDQLGNGGDGHSAGL